MKKWMILAMVLLVAGCGSSRSQVERGSSTREMREEIDYLRDELAQRDDEIDQLKADLRRAEEGTGRRTSRYERDSYSSSSRDSRGAYEDREEAPRSNITVVNRKLDVSIKSVQKALKNARYYSGPVDGEASLKLKEAIRSFQKDEALKADGVVGAKTWSRLGEYLR